MASAVARVLITRAAAGLVIHLQNRHGALMFRQSGDCGDDSSPVCCRVGEFSIEDSDVLLGMLDVVSERQPHGVPVWVSGPQFPAWERTQPVIDVARGRGVGFSLEASEGMRFLLRARAVDGGRSDVDLADCADPLRVQPF
ncbi:DUF779 domain-containing protein [Mycobacterium sp. LTG2003]